jgi:hypothetical protein
VLDPADNAVAPANLPTPRDATGPAALRGSTGEVRAGRIRAGTGSCTAARCTPNRRGGRRCGAAAGGQGHRRLIHAGGAGMVAMASRGFWPDHQRDRPRAQQHARGRDRHDCLRPVPRAHQSTSQHPSQQDGQTGLPPAPYSRPRSPAQATGSIAHRIDQTSSLKAPGRGQRSQQRSPASRARHSLPGRQCRNSQDPTALNLPDLRVVRRRRKVSSRRGPAARPRVASWPFRRRRGRSVEADTCKG